MKLYLVLFICIISTGSIMGNINSVAAAIDFEIDRGYRILLDEESFSGETSYQKAIYIPSGIDVALDVRGSGSAELSGMMRMRDMDFAILTVEKDAGFTVGDTLQIELSYSGAANALPDYMAGSFLRMYEAIFPELRETSGWREIEELQPSILFVYPETANTSFWQTYEYLKEWKSQKGYLIYEYELPVGGSSVSLKDYIQSAYDNWDLPPEYVCLIGDAGGDYNIPTNYFEDGEGDHYYTTLAGDDELSDVHIGRLSFNTINEMQTIVYKIINYERNPFMYSTSWFSRALLTGDPTDSGQSCVYTNINIRELIENNHPEYDYEEIYEAPFASNMLAAVNQGVSYFNYRGFWGMSGWYEMTAEALNNGMMLPFVVTSTCGTGDFAGNGSSRSESFLRAGSISNPRGGIGAVGTATLATHTCFNNCYTMGTAYGLFAEDLRTMGAAHTRGKTSLWLNYPQNPDDASTRFSYWNNLMGDPSGEIWVGIPKELNVECEDVYARTQENIRIRSIDQYGNGAEGLYGCLYNTESDEQHFAWSNEDGYITFNIDDLNSDEYMLSVSGRNFYPFQQEIEISESFDITISNLEFIDENLSGSFEPDETGMINFILANNGEQQYEDILLEISCDDSDIQVDESITIEILDAGDNIAINDIPIHYSGAGNDETGHYITISITGNNINLEDNYQIPVSEMQLEISGYQFSDDNNNLPEPGETVYLSYELTNCGAEDLADIALEVTSGSNLIILGDNIQFPGNIGTNEVYSSILPVSLQILQEYIGGNEAVLYFRLSNEAGFEQELELEFNVGTSSSSEPTGPDEYGYCIYDEYDSEYLAVEYDWIEINTEYELSLPDCGDMGSVCQVDLPFTLRFYDQDYDVLSVCSNGWVAPGYTESASFMNWAIPGEGGISPIIAVFWDDLVNTDIDSAIYYYYNQAEHFLIIEWDRLRNDWDYSLETFEIIIYDRDYYPSSNGNNPLKFQYKEFNNTNQGSYSGHHNGNHGQFTTIGIEDQRGVNGVQYSYNNEYPLTGVELHDESALWVSGIPIPEESSWIILGDYFCENSSGELEIVPGDTVNMILSLQNLGSVYSEDLTLAINSQNLDHVELINSEIVIPGIAAGEVLNDITGLSFNLAADYPSMEPLWFDLTISNGSFFWNYEMRIEVSAALLCLGENEIHFGQVMAGYEKEYVLSIENCGTALLEISSIQSSTPDLEVDFNGVEIIPGDIEEVVLTYINYESGHINENITIISNDILESEKVIPVTGIIVPPPELNIDTSTHYIDLEEGCCQDYSIDFTNTGEGTLELEMSLDGYHNSLLGAKFGGGYLRMNESVVTTEEFTIEAWVRIDGPGFIVNDVNPIFEQRDDDTGDFRSLIGFLAKDISEFTRFGIQGAQSTGLLLMTESPPENEWHHYAAVVGEEIASLYIDGELKAMDFNQEIGGYTTNVTNIHLGACKDHGSMSAALNGMLDEVRFWDRALSEGEIREYMNRSREESDGLTAYWNFNEEGNWQNIINSDLEIVAHNPVWQEESDAKINDWIELEDNSLMVNGGDGGGIELHLDGSWLPELYEEYDMDILLVTNDPLLPEVTIPLSVELVPCENDNNTITPPNSLQQNYPNPFYCSERGDISIKIGYSLAESVSDAIIMIYNIKGQKVNELKIDSECNRDGVVEWDARNTNGAKVASGVYCYVLRINDKNVQSRKMLLLR